MASTRSRHQCSRPHGEGSRDKPQRPSIGVKCPAVSEPVQKTLDIRREATHCPTCGLRFGRDARFCPFDGVQLAPASYDPLRDPLLGTTVEGRYQVLEVLGEGGTGRVYKVRHVALGRLFAMKILRRDLARDEALAARFIQEAQATARVRHPHIIEITDYGSLPEGTPFFVTELLVGQTLRGVIKDRGPLPLPHAVGILKQIAGAVGAAHAAGIVHRDLKPDNIFLVGDKGAAMDVRVVDFGAAKVVGASRMTRDGIVYGTPHYMSPEQASGQPVDHRSDIYSLGIIMYEMFTGRVPFEADTYMGVLTQHMFVQPVPPSRVVGASPELGALEQITLVCLAKGPEDRYASMQALSGQIERALSDFGQSSASQVQRVGTDQASTTWASNPPMGEAAPGEAQRDPQGSPLADADPIILPRRRIPWKWLVYGCAAVTVLVGAIVWAHSQPNRKATGEIQPGPFAAPVSAGTASEAPVTPEEPLRLAPAAASVASPGSAPMTAAPVPPPPATGHRRRMAPTPKIDDVGDPFVVRR
jgi:serine/threonine protein kinase